MRSSKRGWVFFFLHKGVGAAHGVQGADLCSQEEGNVLGCTCQLSQPASSNAAGLGLWLSFPTSITLITPFCFDCFLSFPNKVPFENNHSLSVLLNKKAELFVLIQGSITKGTEHL